MTNMPHEISEKTDIIARLLLSTKGIASMRKLVHGLFTESEILEIAQRLEIVRLLKKGTPQHKVALQLGVGVGTVTRGAREIKLGRL